MLKRWFGCLAVTGMLTVGLTSCSTGPDPEPVAEALATALEAGDFSGGMVPLAGPASMDGETAWVQDVTAGMGDVRRSVEVSHLEETESGRTVTLRWSWDLDEDGEDWTYVSNAKLSLDADEQWQVGLTSRIVHPELTDPHARLVLNRTPAQRGDVLGAGGEVIVADRSVYRIGIDKTKVGAEAVRSAAADVAAVVDVDAGTFADQVENAGPKAFVEAITLREGDAADVLPALDEIDGAAAISDMVPLAPTREFARPILGTVGEATAEIIEESDGQIRASDVVGRSGLQRHYDRELRGSAGLVVEAVPLEGEPTVLYEREPVDGASLTTTLDVDLQARAEGVVAGVGPPSALVAVRPATGEVLAAASGPGGEGYSTATLGQYAPGSTFKLVTALALLRADMTADDVLACTDSITVDGKRFENYDDYPTSAVGDISLRSAVANSCNTALISAADRVSQGDLADAARALGLGGGKTSIGLEVFMGDVPAEAGETTHAASMIGQGEVLASPLAMATVGASIAAGETVVPRFLDDPRQPNGSLTADEAATLSELMRAVVEDGSGEFLQEVTGAPVGAKTGTAEYGSGDPLPTHAWMVATQGDLAVAVFVEDGESGSRTAGPLLEEFLTGQ